MKHTPSPYWAFAVALLPMLLLRDFTPSNELRYLSIADAALRDGTFFTFRLAGEAYTDKPPLYLWLVMLCRGLLGQHYMWALGLFSVVPACVVTSVMYHWTMREVRSAWRGAARWMLLTTGMWLGAALVLRMDMLMCMFIVLALYVFYQMRDHAMPPASLGWQLGAYLFLALFTKGPLGLLIPLVTTLVFMATTGRLRQWGRCWGWRVWIVLLGGCAVWFGGVLVEGGREYLYDLTVHQTAGRAAASFHHARPFWYYAATLWYAMLPWAMAVVGTIIVAAARRHFHTEMQHYFLTIIVVTFVMLSCFSSKLDIYLLPAYPFVIYLAAMVLHDYDRSAWLRLALAVPAVLFLLAEPAVIVLAHREATAWIAVPAVHVAASLLSASGLATLGVLYGGRRAVSGVTTLAAGLLVAVFAAGFAMPQLNDRLGYGTLCREAVRVADSRGATRYFSYRMHRTEGMDVYLGQPVTAVTTEALAAGLPAGSLLLVPATRLPEVCPPPVVRPVLTVGPYAIVAY